VREQEQTVEQQKLRQLAYVGSVTQKPLTEICPYQVGLVRWHPSYHLGERKEIQVESEPPLQGQGEERLVQKQILLRLAHPEKVRASYVWHRPALIPNIHVLKKFELQSLVQLLV
jgi:hypothetical protein